VLESSKPELQPLDIAKPVPGNGQVLVEVSTCAVCRTDLHVIDGELPEPKLPLVPGHEIVGYVRETGPETRRFAPGDRVGIPWLGWTCGRCRYCTSGQENLCDNAKFTGYTLDGGYAEYTMANEEFCVSIPPTYKDAHAGPLLCAGLIGYRCLVKAGDAETIAIYGFGAAAHIISQIAVHQGRKIYAFTRPGDLKAQQFAESLGAVWTGDSTRPSPVPLDAAIIFAPVGALIPAALQSVRKAGRVICGGIHMSDIPRFPYHLLWGERQVVSVANLTRRDSDEFMKLASRIPIRTAVELFPLEAANAAVSALRMGQVQGAAVLVTPFGKTAAPQ